MSDDDGTLIFSNGVAVFAKRAGESEWVQVSGPPSPLPQPCAAPQGASGSWISLAADLRAPSVPETGAP